MFKHMQVLFSLSLYSISIEYIFAYMKYVLFIIWIGWNTSEKIWACYSRRQVGPMECPFQGAVAGPWTSSFGTSSRVLLAGLTREDWYQIFGVSFQRYFALGLTTYFGAFDGDSTAKLLTCSLKKPKKRQQRICTGDVDGGFWPSKQTWFHRWS